MKLTDDGCYLANMAAHDSRIQVMAGSQLDQFYACAGGTENTRGKPSRIWLGRLLGTTRFRLSRQDIHYVGILRTLRRN